MIAALFGGGGGGGKGMTVKITTSAARRLSFPTKSSWKTSSADHIWHTRATKIHHPSTRRLLYRCRNRRWGRGRWGRGRALKISKSLPARQQQMISQKSSSSVQWGNRGRKKISYIMSAYSGDELSSQMLRLDRETFPPKEPPFSSTTLSPLNIPAFMLILTPQRAMFSHVFSSLIDGPLLHRALSQWYFAIVGQLTQSNRTVQFDLQKQMLLPMAHYSMNEWCIF